MKTALNSSSSLVIEKQRKSTWLKNVFKFLKSNEATAEKTKKKVSVFIVDDDPLYLKALELSVSSNIDSAAIYTFQTGEACLHQMKKKPTIVILDYYLNSETPYAWNGMMILRQIKKISPKTKVIILSSQDSLNVAIECMENGAYDYISKSQTSLLRLNNIIANIANDKSVTSNFFKIAEYVLFIIIALFIAYALLSH